MEIYKLLLDLIKSPEDPIHYIKLKEHFNSSNESLALQHLLCVKFDVNNTNNNKESQGSDKTNT
jgi:hypothetical protein